MMPYEREQRIETVETDEEARAFLPASPLAAAMYTAEREAGKTPKAALEEVLATWRAVWRSEVIGGHKKKTHKSIG